MAESRPEDDAPDNDDHPGRPIGPDEIDPELMALGRTRARVGPVLAGAIVVFCVYFMIRLMPDLRFSFRDDTPKQVDKVERIVNKDGITAEDFVRVDLRPDHSFALRVAESEAARGHRLTPVLGTNSKLWLLDEGSPWATKTTYHTIYQGRLRYLSDMPFYDHLRSYVAKGEPSPRYVPTRAVRTALENKAESVKDGAGDPLAVTPSTPVIISELAADRAMVKAYLGERLPDIAAWRKALIAAGLPSAASKPVAETKEVITWELSDPEGLAGVTKKLTAAKLFGARTSELRRKYRATWGILTASPAGLVVSGKAALPWANLSSISLTVRRKVPSDAMVLIANERPGAYWYIKPVYVVLGLFAVLFLWAFVRSIRRPRSATEQTKTASAAA
jgi:hypothetical protein